MVLVFFTAFRSHKHFQSQQHSTGGEPAHSRHHGKVRRARAGGRCESPRGLKVARGHSPFTRWLILLFFLKAARRLRQISAFVFKLPFNTHAVGRQSLASAGSPYVSTSSMYELCGPKGRLKRRGICQSLFLILVWIPPTSG